MEQTNRLDLVMKRGKWHAMGWVAGERVRRSTGTADKIKAEEVRLKWLRDGAKGVKPKSAASRFEQAIDLYLSERGAALSGGTYRYIMKFKERLGEVALIDFDDGVIEDYRRRYCEGKKPLTQRRELAQLRSVLNLATERKLLNASIKIGMPKKKRGTGRRLVYLEQDERDILIETLKANYTEELAFFAQFMAHTGARTGEAMKLVWDYVDLRRNEVVFMTLKGGDGPRERTVPLNAKAREALVWMRDRFGDDGRVFRKANGEPYNPNINKWGKEEGSCAFNEITKAAREAGIRKHVTSYTLRHTFASLMRKKGGSLDRIKELMGHSSIDMTLIYAHLLVEDHRQDVDLLI